MTITLSWMDKLRELEEKDISDSEILNLLRIYGKIEEERIDGEFRSKSKKR